jgi:bifunctional non-homologous end joining protein LigD
LIIPPFEAQLAGQHGEFPTQDLDAFICEEKFDGMRGLVVFDTDEQGNPRLALWNRHGENKGRLAAQTVLREELEAMGKAIPKLYEGTVLDGELIADSWNQTMHLAAMSGVHDGDGRLNFIVFDLVYLMGKNLKDQPWSVRRNLLEKVLKPFTNDTSMLALSGLLPLDKSELQRIWDNGGEGVIIKRKDAPYEPGGRHYWQKLKLIETAEAFILGYTPGQGKYSDTIGAVILGQYVDGKIQKVTQVSGMTDEVRRAFTDDNIGDVVEFEHYGKTVNTSYRHPQFKRFRPDKAKEDCTWEAS